MQAGDPIAVTLIKISTPVCLQLISIDFNNFTQNSDGVDFPVPIYNISANWSDLAKPYQKISLGGGAYQTEEIGHFIVMKMVLPIVILVVIIEVLPKQMLMQMKMV